ncbi:MAG: Gfo/Idh/MocA family oxidoreductase, partial [Saccharospirillaceae bacterium]|nr:Gfo/Idh/MocA family oxidoreductase [Saccharospirillaceae bacterium]
MILLLVGAGQLGSRHLQSIALVSQAKKVYVVEPNEFCRIRALDRWQEVAGTSNVEIEFTSLNKLDIESNITFAIVATLSKNRVDIIKKIIDLDVKNIISEKVVFQSIAEYRDVMNYARSKGVKIFINHIYRYVKLYQEIKSKYGNKQIKMKLEAGNNGMGCNLIHFIDLFKFISESEISEINLNINRP